jgi:gamma-butyrobetaine dioxygenase
VKSEKHNGDASLRPSAIVRARHDAGRVLVTWADGQESAYHSIWLRHSLFFPTHRKADSGDEFATLPDDPDTVWPREIAIGSNGELVIEWHPDGQISRFDPTWLRDRSPNATDRRARKRPPILWDASIEKSYPQASYPRFAEKDVERLRAYRGLLDHGFLLLRDVPPVPGQIEEVSKFLGIITVSHVGRIFDVRLDPTVRSGATSTRYLGPHVDESCRYFSSGMSVLHCIKAHPHGGQSMLVDGFAICKKLKSSNPAAYDVLARVPLFYDCNSYGTEIRAFGKVICEDLDGDLMGVRFNDRSVSPLEAPEELIKRTYASLRAFIQLLNDRAHQFRFTLAPGDMLVYDNQRVLHGRTWFDASLGERHLQNCTIDRDIVHGKFRELARKLGEPDWNQILPCGVTV